MFRLHWCLPITCWLVLPAAAQDARSDPDAAVTPAHVYQKVAAVRAEIDLIRLEMGRREVDPPPIKVKNAAPREVFFQALTLFRKANRLAYEHTRGQVDEPQVPEGQIQPADVRVVVEAALDRVQVVKDAIGIVEASDLPALQSGIEPSQVINLIVAANREINNLLDQQFAPGDVYREVTVAIAYMARLLDSPGAVSTPPKPPEFERRKRPANVYRKLVNCFDEIHLIGEISGIDMLSLEVEDERVDGVEPSDVYDIASLLVAELTHLHGKREGANPPRKVHNPGRKLPSHVYQRIGILCTQMEALRRKVDSDPGWLGEPEN